MIAVSQMENCGSRFTMEYLGETGFPREGLSALTGTVNYSLSGLLVPVSVTAACGAAKESQSSEIAGGWEGQSRAHSLD